jgi:predicted tellurium resistance membrane protein TerC
MWRELRSGQLQAVMAETGDGGEVPGGGEIEAADSPQATKTLRQAMVAIIVADVSMSLDNVLAVAGAAHEFLWVLVFGLTLSIALMAVAANYLARLLERHHWVAYVGLVIVAYVAGDMIYRGLMEIAQAAA